MSLPFRLPRRTWLVIPICCLVFMGWCDHLRLHHVKFVSNVAKEEAKVDVSSPTGYADGKRWLIVPEHNNPTYQWIEETQLMVAKGDWRVRWRRLRERSLWPRGIRRVAVPLVARVPRLA